MPTTKNHEPNRKTSTSEVNIRDAAGQVLCCIGSKHACGFRLLSYNRHILVFASSKLSRPASVRSFRRELLSWYRLNRRSLPWRRTRDPYRIWVSEIMLQQTRVAAVLDHYQRFLKRFPAIRDLAAAGESAVLAEWSGLGYYRRARMLHRAAQVLVSEQRGVLPHSSAELRHLPGIGRYTANAIASIAYSEPVAVVDGNVERVLARISGKSLSGEAIWTAAHGLLDVAQPANFNQAMMELGATICLPGAPRCELCPVKRFCMSRDLSPARIAIASGNKARHQRFAYLSVVRRRDSILLRQRSDSERLMAGMWELPEMANVPTRPALLQLRHSITTTDWRVAIFSSSRFKKDKSMRWVKLSEVSHRPLTGLTRKVLRRLNLLA